MSTNKTKHYQLHSWEPEDKFQRAEINENFTAVDDAIAAEVERAKGAESALSSGKADKTTVDALTTTVGTKADSSALTNHTGNTTAHITAAERTAWNGKQAKLTFDTSPKSGSSNPVTSGGVYTAVAAKADSSTLTSHTSNSTVHITAAERTAWNGKTQVVVGSYTADGSGNWHPITLGFQPRAVFIANCYGMPNQNSMTFGGLFTAVSSTSQTCVAQITSTGFQVRSGAYQSEYSPYSYVAIP